MSGIKKLSSATVPAEAGNGVSPVTGEQPFPPLCQGMGKEN